MLWFLADMYETTSERLYGLLAQKDKLGPFTIQHDTARWYGEHSIMIANQRVITAGWDGLSFSEFYLASDRWLIKLLKKMYWAVVNLFVEHYDYEEVPF